MKIAQSRYPNTYDIYAFLPVWNYDQIEANV